MVWNNTIQKYKVIHNKKLVDQTGLYKYSSPAIITYGCGNEFIGHALKNNLTKNEYRIKAKCETTENAQENSISERTHQVIVNLVRMFDMKKINQTRINPDQVS